MLEDAGSWRDETDSRGLDAERGSQRSVSPQGLAWSWEIDLAELLAAVTGQEGQDNAACPEPGHAGQPEDHQADRQDRREPPEDQEAALEAELDALDAGQGRPLAPGEIAGLVAGRMPPGPGLAALLAAAPPADLADYALPDVAAAYRRISSWAQAMELACVAKIAAHAAARDPEVGIGADGRPARVTREACAEVSLALTTTGAGAEW